MSDGNTVVNSEYVAEENHMMPVISNTGTSKKVVKALVFIATLILEIAIVLIQEPGSEQKGTKYKVNNIVRLIELMTQKLEVNPEVLQKLDRAAKMRLVRILKRLSILMMSQHDTEDSPVKDETTGYAIEDNDEYAG